MTPLMIHAINALTAIVVLSILIISIIGISGSFDNWSTRFVEKPKVRRLKPKKGKLAV